MEKNTPNVWDWIAEQCLERGWHSSASVAKFLACQNKELWGTRLRKVWVEKYMDCQLAVSAVCCPANFLVAVAEYRDFKVGCRASGYNCEDCYVAKKLGPCNQRGTVTRFWQYLLEKESGEKVDEEIQEDLKHLIEEVR